MLKQYSDAAQGLGFPSALGSTEPDGTDLGRIAAPGVMERPTELAVMRMYQLISCGENESRRAVWSTRGDAAGWLPFAIVLGLVGTIFIFDLRPPPGFAVAALYGVVVFQGSELSAREPLQYHLGLTLRALPRQRRGVSRAA